ncbi:hypothetical protein CHS0354_005103 [Potamilus streckersoni]|uniref:CWH43-like N-terminal domain-containing protein n=2 Tax=Potamilus streckersoni TaxID=2493646 RepID=A0AAE0SI53_9BIVA|nr:hypothetical protein CHS0354_005103 [Potamilus streckersoni]
MTFEIIEMDNSNDPNERTEFINNDHCRPTDEDKKEKPPGIMSFLCLIWLKRRLWLLPILTSGWLFLSFWVSYIIAVANNHVEPNFPYISHTAIEAPERCVFGQMVNIGAVMLFMNILLRYLYIKTSLVRKTIKFNSRWYKINLTCLVMGFFSAFGLSMVANFQTEVQRGPHYVGAGLAFGLGMIICWIQCAISWKVHYKLNNKSVLLIIQIIIASLLTTSGLIFGISKGIYKARQYAGHGTKWDVLREVYLTSTVTEWVLAIFILMFTLTFIPEFKRITISDPQVELISDQEIQVRVNDITQVSQANGSSVTDAEEGKNTSSTTT